MNTTIEFEKQTKALIDDLKSVCANYGLGNDGNEFKIITQVFLYKFMNDKFIHEIKKLDDNIAKADDWEKVLNSYSDDDLEMLMMQLDENTAQLKPKHFISRLFQRQNEPKFDTIFDETLLEVGKINIDLFSVLTEGGEKITLFEDLSKYVTDKRDEFCKAIINKLINFSFENIFHEKFDFYATIFEYLIKDYNTNSGGKYAEYFTPHAVAKIMARCLVHGEVKNVTCYDPSAGSGTLLMNLAHQIGEDKCTIYSQDISQKSSNLLRLNLILNDLVHSIPNIIKGNTLTDPYHKVDGELRKFNYIVSNPPFKLDFSNDREELDADHNKNRFFAGTPKVPAKKKESMAIYLMFIQHIVYSLKDNGKAAIVVPTGFITAQTGIEKKIREKIVNEKMLAGVISMPGNIFANTPTSVSILFLDKSNEGSVSLIDASKLGTAVKEDGNKRTILTEQEEGLIIDTFLNKTEVDDFSVCVDYDRVKTRNFSFSAGQYFEVKVNYVELNEAEFKKQMSDISNRLIDLKGKSNGIQNEISKSLNGLVYVDTE